MKNMHKVEEGWADRGGAAWEGGLVPRQRCRDEEGRA